MVTNNIFGRLLYVDLSHRRTETRPVTADDLTTYLGGRGLGARLLQELLPPGADPLGPDNPLIMTIGPLTGTVVPMASRFVVVAKSPLTNIYGMSLCGGSLGAEMRSAGYLGVVIQGAAAEPCCLFIEPDGKVTFRDARHLWGLDTFKTQDEIHRELGDPKVKVACIGPAGENQVKIAGILSERRIAGRTGMGAVMGAKNLKAIVFRAAGDKVPVHDADRLEALAADAVKKLTSSPVTKGLNDLGTPRGIMTMNAVGVLPTRNFQSGVFEAAEQISGERLKKEFTTRKFTTCYRCPVVCSRITRVNAGPYQGAETEGPDYETLYAMGAQCGNSNMESIIYGDMLCDQLGLDTMSVGSAVAFAMECFERGILTEADTDGLGLRFGAYRAMTQLITQIANKQGLGQALGEGPLGLIKRYPQAETYAMHVKGLWLGGYEPRGLKGEALAFATANRGGCHSAGGYTIHAELHKGDEYRFSPQGKASLVKGSRDLRALYDCAIMCSFSMAVLGVEPPRQMFTAATGIELDEASWIGAIDRICNIERALSVREGLRPADDSLPARFQEPMPDGPCKGQVVELDQMKNEFYSLVGWDRITGAPTSM